MKTVIALTISLILPYTLDAQSTRRETDPDGLLWRTPIQDSARSKQINEKEFLTSVDDQPVPVERADAKYPTTALKDSAEGVVYILVFIDEKGVVQLARTMKSPREDLSRAAIESVMKWKFYPTRMKSRPVKSQATIPFRFKIAEYPMTFIRSPLTPTDIQEAFRVLGLQANRFTYEVPYPHTVRSFLEKYVDGKLVKTIPIGGSSVPGGKQSITLFLYDSDGLLQFSLSQANGYTSRTDTISVKKYNTRGSKVFENPRLSETSRVPIFAYLANPDSIWISEPFRTAQQVASMYKLAIIVYVQVEPEEKNQKK